MRRKMLVCAYFAKNAGDDLFLKILFDRYPDVSWDLLTANRNYNKVFKDYRNVHVIYSYRNVTVIKKNYNLFFTINELLLDYRKYDGLIHIGGSIFMQSPAWKQKLLERDYLVKKFKKINKSAFILGANFGPYTDQSFIKQYKELFMMCDDVCFRDSYSYNLFKELGNVRLAPDIVFNLDGKANQKQEKSIGISVINLENRKLLEEYGERYNQKISDIIEYYSRQSYRISLFSFCENEGDLIAINQIKGLVDKQYRNNISVFNYQGDLERFLEAFQSCETIIGTRFHSLILAMVYNQNFIPIIYSDKTLNVLKDLSLDDTYWRIRDIEQLEPAGIEKNQNNKLTDRVKVNEAVKQFEKLDLFMSKNLKKERVR